MRPFLANTHSFCYSHDFFTPPLPFSFPPIHQCVYFICNTPFFSGNYQVIPFKEESRALPTMYTNTLLDTHKDEAKQADESHYRAPKREVIRLEQNNIFGQKQSESRQNTYSLKKERCLKEKEALKPEQSRFVKKNTQSNIVSQIFSFLWSPDKNLQYLSKILGTKEKIKAFDAIMRTVKSKCKSQLNRMFLKQLLRSQEWPAAFKKLKNKIKSHSEISNEELQGAIRRLSFLYLRLLHRSSIITSKKMNKKLWDTHFKKCKEINRFLFEEQSP